MRALIALCLSLVLTSAASAQEAPVPPVMVAVLSSAHVPDDVAAAVQAALVDGVRPLAGGRPVLALALPEMRDRLAACADASCRGAFLAESGAIGAVIAQLSRRGTRGDTAMTLDLVDPVSGASRLSQSASLADAASVSASLALLIAALQPVMFSPPPAPVMLRVSVNVDGASIFVDDTLVGSSPIAAQRIAPGHHVVRIERDGYARTQRMLDAQPGDQPRLEVTLAVLEGGSAPVATTSSIPGPVGSPWYEEWYVWAAVGGGVLVVAGIIIGVFFATQPGPAAPDPMGIPIPGLHF